MTLAKVGDQCHCPLILHGIVDGVHEITVTVELKKNLEHGLFPWLLTYHNALRPPLAGFVAIRYSGLFHSHTCWRRVANKVSYLACSSLVNLNPLSLHTLRNACKDVTTDCFMCLLGLLSYYNTYARLRTALEVFVT